MKLIITRHGETLENINKICQGQTEGTLSENGIEQAKKLALRLKDTKIDAIYSSSLRRTIDTSKEILKFHPQLKLNLDKRIMERYLERFENKPFPEDWDWDNLPEGVETNQEMYNRVKDFLDDIYKKHKDETVLIVCHGGTKIAFLNIIYNKSPEESNTWDHIKNTSISEFTIEEDGKHKVHVLNDTTHLK
ncbi:histidine phosphatase family protein [Candidatus Woesearchaeota archaeon]|nr:histidine phosphatase family protein [Candidatus Woesearchaeota archaeon]